MNLRENTKAVRIGSLTVGGGAPVRIQSMCNTKTSDPEKTAAQINRLTEAGCEIIRVSVPDQASADAIALIKKNIRIPLVADIHFDWRMAVAAMENGADKIRINPGNIGSRENLARVVSVARERQIPIRVGVNAGSMEKDLLERYGVSAEGLCESALRNVAAIEELGYDNLVVSIKASNLLLCKRAYELFAERSAYPLHIGITETGPMADGIIKSAMGIGMLLTEGLGDTLRVSLTGDPVEEVRVGRKILQYAGLRKFGVEVISCPTCARTDIDIISLAAACDKALAHIEKPLKVAVMGCAVNGPGEAREADLGVAGGKGEGLLFMKGQIIGKVPEAEIIPALVSLAEKL